MEIEKYNLNQKRSEFRSRERKPQRKKPNPYRPQAIKNDGIIFISFFIFLVVFGLLFMIWKKQDISETEKRTLQQKPKLTSERLFSGEYGKEIEAYYADQFPMREQFMGFYKSLVSLMNSIPGGKQKIHLVTASKNQPGDTLPANDPQTKNQDTNNQVEPNKKSETNLENIIKEKNNNETGDNPEKNIEENKKEKKSKPRIAI